MSAHNFLSTHDNAMLIDPIKDPGDAGAIKILKSGICKLISGSGAETRTLADPVGPGLQITIAMMTDGGGTITLTFASPFNTTNNNTVTFDTVGNAFTVVSVPISTSAYVWQDITADGAAVSTV